MIISIIRSICLSLGVHLPLPLVFVSMCVFVPHWIESNEWWWHFSSSAVGWLIKTHTHEWNENKQHQHSRAQKCNDLLHKQQNHHHSPLMFILFILHMYKPHYLLQWNFTFVAFRARRFSSYAQLPLRMIACVQKRLKKHTHNSIIVAQLSALENPIVSKSFVLINFAPLFIEEPESGFHKWKIN